MRSGIGGISFNGTGIVGHWPVGTNLFDANQAKAMIEHILDHTPASVPAQVDDETMRKDAERLDFLERELEVEADEIRRINFVKTRSLFRRCQPITRAAIDTAIAASNPIASSAEGKVAKIPQGDDRGSGGGA